MSSNNLFPARLEIALKARGMSQKELADRIGVTTATVSRYVTGSRSPQLSIAMKIAECLDTTLDSLISDNEVKPEALSWDKRLLVTCYDDATPAQKNALWSIISSYGLLPRNQVEHIKNAYNI